MHIRQCASKCAKNVQANVQKMCKMFSYTIYNILISIIDNKTMC